MLGLCYCRGSQLGSVTMLGVHLFMLPGCYGRMTRLDVHATRLSRSHNHVSGEQRPLLLALRVSRRVSLACARGRG